MKKHLMRGLLAVASALGILGFARFQPPPPEALFSSAREIPPLDYFASVSSFSEVEQARAQLQALARRSLYVLQLRQTELQRALHAGDSGQQAQIASQMRQLVTDYERALEEFHDTSEEPELAAGLLHVLASLQESDRWLDVYLELLYRRPTEPVIGRLAGRALAAGRASGRLEEVERAFRYVVRIPLEFESKTMVQATLKGSVPDCLTGSPASSPKPPACG